MDGHSSPGGLQHVGSTALEGVVWVNVLQMWQKSVESGWLAVYILS